MEGNTSDEGEDAFSIVCGDLGLGESVRRHNLIEMEQLRGLENMCSQHPSPAESRTSLNLPHHPRHHPQDSPGSHFSSCLTIPGLGNGFSSVSDPLLYDPRSLCSQTSVYGGHSERGGLSPVPDETQEQAEEPQLEEFPKYADVPYGTSLRQHKKLLEAEVENLRRQHGADFSHLGHSGADTDGEKDTKKTKGSRKKRSFRLSGKEISSKLTEAMTIRVFTQKIKQESQVVSIKKEMEELKLELDACQRRLDAKYQAVTILKEQADYADAELKNTERRANETSRRLEQEVNKLQFELEWKESSFIDSQQKWAERFDRVCQENTVLMSKLEARNEELRKANAHKAATSRERDELLALVDVAERLKYEQGKSKVADDEYGQFSSSELAVLGACKCRMSNPEPCGCAHAAASLRKEVAKLRDEGDWLQQRWEESSLTVDAYRAAFEEQLGKSRKLSQRLSQIATLSSRSAKAKAAIKWLIQVMNDEESEVPPSPVERGKPAEKGSNSLADMSLQELVTVLTDMISEKNEALAHQKLAAQVLADKLERQERRAASATTLTTPSAYTYRRGSTREVGVQSPSLPRPHRVLSTASASSEFYIYDEVFDLNHGSGTEARGSSVDGSAATSVVVEKESGGSDLVSDLYDHDVGSGYSNQQSSGLSQSDVEGEEEEEEESSTPFVSADDGDEGEEIKRKGESEAEGNGNEKIDAENGDNDEGENGKPESDLGGKLNSAAGQGVEEKSCSQAETVAAVNGDLTKTS